MSGKITRQGDRGRRCARNATPEGASDALARIGRLAESEAFVYSPSMAARGRNRSRCASGGRLIRRVRPRSARRAWSRLAKGPQIFRRYGRRFEEAASAQSRRPKPCAATIAALQKQARHEGRGRSGRVAQLRPRSGRGEARDRRAGIATAADRRGAGAHGQGRELLHRASAKSKTAARAYAKAEFLGAAGRIETTPCADSRRARSTIADGERRFPARPDPVARPAAPRRRPRWLRGARRLNGLRTSRPRTVRSGKLTGSLLTALAQNRDGLTRDQLSLLSGYSVNSSHFATCSAHYAPRGTSNAAIPSRPPLRGRAALGHYEPLPEAPVCARTG